MKKIFIDGSAGTTGLRIHERLAQRDEFEFLTLSEDKRKDADAKAKIINESDITFLCLPDDAARESVGLVTNPDTVIIDTSTAHRTNEEFAYGFAELDDSFEEKIKNSKRIAVPGCHASGFIALIYPLIQAGLLNPDTPLSCHSITGYSGGGKKMIAEYETDARNTLLSAPRQYGLTQAHKHLKEMKAITGISSFPIFTPIVSDFYSGMTVTVPLFLSQINGTAEDIKKLYKERYDKVLVKYTENASNDGFVSGLAMSGRDSMTVCVEGNDERILLIAQYDNLGKGASGSAIECLNLVCGYDIEKGLVI